MKRYWLKWVDSITLTFSLCGGNDHDCGAGVLVKTGLIALQTQTPGPISRGQRLTGASSTCPRHASVLGVFRRRAARNDGADRPAPATLRSGHTPASGSAGAPECPFPTPNECG